MEIIAYIITAGLYFFWTPTVALRNAVFAPFPELIQAILLPVCFFTLVRVIRSIFLGIGGLFDSAGSKRK